MPEVEFELENWDTGRGKCYTGEGLVFEHYMLAWSSILKNVTL